MDLRISVSAFFLHLCVVAVRLPSPCAAASDADALLGLKAAADPGNTSLLQWPSGADFCRWQGVRDCLEGRVSKLVVEHMNLTGKLDGKSLNRLDQLRVLSFKDNSLSGDIPDFSGLHNLKALYLNGNAFTGRFPASLAGLHRLKTIVLSDNRISGEIPPEITTLPRLYTIYLDGNDFSGPIPRLSQPSLRFLNLSGNRLSGQIPKTPALAQFNSSAFSGNPGLCGDAIHKPCPPPPAASIGISPTAEAARGEHKNRKKTIIIASVSAAAGALLIMAVVVVLIAGVSRRRRKKIITEGEREKKAEEVSGGGGGAVVERGEGSGYGGGGKGGGGFSWESEGLGKLVFIGEAAELRYSLEELLKASAETLGRGTLGSTYKAVMESGYIVTVKRLKDARQPGLEEFRRQMEVIGRMRHPNLVAVRAYFQAKEERLLVYDYFPNGSLFSLIHGSRPSGGGKPLHWTSCLKIAEDLATGLLYLHQNFDIAHGNLKSSNVLLGSDFESCLTDYCLHPFRNPDSTDQESSAASLFYKAPECRDPVRRPLTLPTQPSDVYSFGVILLELLTGKTPFQDLVQEHGSDIPKWVKSVREEEIESGDEPSSGNETSEEKLGALLSIAMACVAVEPESRPRMQDVLRMVREARSEAQMSSNSSDHSPGRWSDTVQSLPREEHQSI